MYLVLRWILDILLLGLGFQFSHFRLRRGGALISFHHFLVATAILDRSLVTASEWLCLLVCHCTRIDGLIAEIVRKRRHLIEMRLE